MRGKTSRYLRSNLTQTIRRSDYVNHKQKKKKLRKSRQNGIMEIKAELLRISGETIIINNSININI